MSDQRIVPERVTKPIQLLAAWLVGLIVVNSSFLFAAKEITHPDWASALLVIASIVNVPIFIGALFLLQTKFRPQMQEDSYYSQYLERENTFTIKEDRRAVEVVEREIVETADKIVQSLGVSAKGREKPIANILRKSQHEVLSTKHGQTRTLSELYKSPETWDELLDQWGTHVAFIREVEGLLADGLAEKKFKGYRRTALTKLGREIAHQAEQEGVLFFQRNKDFWENRFDGKKNDA